MAGLKDFPSLAPVRARDIVERLHFESRPMAVQSVHPSAFELAFRLYDRAIHPELFDIQSRSRVEGPGWTARVSICTGGHVIELRTPAGIATELAIPAMLATPDRGLTAEFVAHGEGP